MAKPEKKYWWKLTDKWMGLTVITGYSHMDKADEDNQLLIKIPNSPDSYSFNNWITEADWTFERIDPPQPPLTDWEGAVIIAGKDRVLLTRLRGKWHFMTDKTLEDSAVQELANDYLEVISVGQRPVPDDDEEEADDFD